MPKLCVVYDLSFGKGVPLGTKENEKKKPTLPTISSYLFQRGERGNLHKCFDKSSFCPDVKYVNYPE